MGGGKLAGVAWPLPSPDRRLLFKKGQPIRSAQKGREKAPKPRTERHLTNRGEEKYEEGDGRGGKEPSAAPIGSGGRLTAYIV